MRTKPSIEYSGLTIIIDKPSRFDDQFGRLLSAKAGLFIQDCISPIALDSCDIRTVGDSADFMPGTKCVALLGRQAADYYRGNVALHGYPFFVKQYPAVVAFYPQDCCDHKNIESADGADDEDSKSDRETKDASPTKRNNYRFWTKWHLQKFLNAPVKKEPKAVIRPYPSSAAVIKYLSSLRNTDIYLDIETSRAHNALTCIGISSPSIFPEVFVLPVYRYNGALAYNDWPQIWKALALAFKRNTLVIHNSMFDLTVLCGFYKFPYPAMVYDTMLANHRCFSEIEKSLAHCIAMWTNQHYHKDTNTEAYNAQSERNLWQYNGQDVFTLKLIKDAQLQYAAQQDGLLQSIEQVNASVIPYLRNSLTGLRIDRFKLSGVSQELKRAAKQYCRIIQTLIGDKSFNPNSPVQVKDYFHKRLNYPVQARNETGAPKLGSKQLYQLLVKTGNPLITAILRYRKAAKDVSMLESELWSTP